VATVGNLATGSASVEISLDTFQTQTVTATIQANQTTSINVELIRNTQAAGGVFTTNVDRHAVRERQGAYDRAAGRRGRPALASDRYPDAGDFALPDCTPSNPDTNPSASECVRFTETRRLITRIRSRTRAPPRSPLSGSGPCGLRATLMLDQSGSILETDPTNARLFSANAFMETVDAASSDSVLLTAFAADPRALIPTTPLWYAGTFTSDGSSYFDALDALGTQAKGGTPLYRGLYPEATDPANESGFTAGLIDYVEANAPAGLRKAIVIFTDGEGHGMRGHRQLSCEARPRDRSGECRRHQPVHDRAFEPGRLRGAGRAREGHRRHLPCSQTMRNS
jgi:hypothetical protein